MHKLKRIFRHLMHSHWRIRRAFPPATLQAIAQQIQAGEVQHGGEIRFVVEGSLWNVPLFRHQSARERAIDVFSLLRMWDTEQRNGVLIYLLMADQSVEIIADRGIGQKVDQHAWESLCREMESAFGSGQFQAGTLRGIGAVNQLLTLYFPSNAPRRNELPNTVVVL